MELVKSVYLSITDEGNIFTAEQWSYHPHNYSIYHDTITIEKYGTIEKFIELIKKSLPQDFFIKDYLYKNSIIIENNLCNEIFIKFELSINENGIFGYKSKYNDIFDKKQIFYYAWGSEINTFNFFSNILSIAKNIYKDLSYRKKLVKLFLCEVKVENITKGYITDYFHYNVKIADGPAYTFHYEPKKEEFTLLGHTIYDYEYDSYSYESISDIKNLIAKKTTYLEDMIAIKDLITSPIPEETVKSELTYFEEIAKEQDRKKELNKLILPMLKDMPRVPELMKRSVHHLLSMLTCSRKNKSNDKEIDGFTVTQIKAELTHRKHVPKGQAGKEHRRAKSQGKS